MLLVALTGVNAGVAMAKNVRSADSQVYEAILKSELLNSPMAPYSNFFLALVKTATFRNEPRTLRKLRDYFPSCDEETFNAFLNKKAATHFLRITPALRRLCRWISSGDYSRLVTLPVSAGVPSAQIQKSFDTRYPGALGYIVFGNIAYNSRQTEAMLVYETLRPTGEREHTYLCVLKRSNRNHWTITDWKNVRLYSGI